MCLCVFFSGGSRIFGKGWGGQNRNFGKEGPGNVICASKDVSQCFSNQIFPKLSTKRGTWAKWAPPPDPPQQKRHISFDFTAIFTLQSKSFSVSSVQFSFLLTLSLTVLTSDFSKFCVLASVSVKIKNLCC